MFTIAREYHVSNKLFPLPFKNKLYTRLATLTMLWHNFLMRNIHRIDTSKKKKKLNFILMHRLWFMAKYSLDFPLLQRVDFGLQVGNLLPQKRSGFWPRFMCFIITIIIIVSMSGFTFRSLPPSFVYTLYRSCIEIGRKIQKKLTKLLLQGEVGK